LLQQEKEKAAVVFLGFQVSLLSKVADHMSADPCSHHSSGMGNLGCFCLPGLLSAFYVVINSRSWRSRRAFQSSQ